MKRQHTDIIQCQYILYNRQHGFCDSPTGLWESYQTKNKDEVEEEIPAKKKQKSENDFQF